MAAAPGQLRQQGQRVDLVAHGGVGGDDDAVVCRHQGQGVAGQAGGLAGGILAMGFGTPDGGGAAQRRLLGRHIELGSGGHGKPVRSRLGRWTRGASWDLRLQVGAA